MVPYVRSAPRRSAFCPKIKVKKYEFGIEIKNTQKRKSPTEKTTVHHVLMNMHKNELQHCTVCIINRDTRPESTKIVVTIVIRTAPSQRQCLSHLPERLHRRETSNGTACTLGNVREPISKHRAFPNSTP